MHIFFGFLPLVIMFLAVSKKEFILVLHDKPATVYGPVARLSNFPSLISIGPKFRTLRERAGYPGDSPEYSRKGAINPSRHNHQHNALCNPEVINCFTLNSLSRCFINLLIKLPPLSVRMYLGAPYWEKRVAASA